MTKEEEIYCRTRELAMRMEHGASDKELKKEYVLKWKCSRKTVNRMLKMAKDRIFGSLKDPDSVLECIRAESVLDILNKNYLSSMELEGKLCEIVKNSNDPDRSDQIRAIALLLRLRGKIYNSGNQPAIKATMDSIPEQVKRDMELLPAPRTN